MNDAERLRDKVTEVVDWSNPPCGGFSDKEEAGMSAGLLAAIVEELGIVEAEVDALYNYGTLTGNRVSLNLGAALRTLLTAGALEGDDAGKMNAVVEVSEDLLGWRKKREQIVRDGVDRLWMMASALAELRAEPGAWEPEFGTWEEYVSSSFGISAATDTIRAYKARALLSEGNLPVEHLCLQVSGIASLLLFIAYLVKSDERPAK